MDNTLINELPIGLVCWYNFSKGKRILFVHNNENDGNTIYEYLSDKGFDVCAANLDGSGELVFNTESDQNREFDYAISIRDIELVERPLVFLENIKKCLSAEGTLLLIAENALGLRYFIGDKDPYTYRNFDSIESYTRVNPYDRKALSGHLYTGSELTRILMDSGYNNVTKYSVFPSLEYPQLFYRQDTYPNEKLSTRIFPIYHTPETVYLDEMPLREVLSDNDIFHQVANAYLFECSLNKVQCDVKHATVNMNRGRKLAMKTIIKDDDSVVKSPVFSVGLDRLLILKENHDALQRRNVNVVPLVFDKDALVTPYVEGVSGVEYFKKIVNEKSLDAVWEKINEFIDILMNSSDTYIEKETGEIILKKGYIDLTLINCIYVDDTPIFIDQEYTIDNMPVKVLIYRFVEYLYFGNVRLNELIPRDFIEEKLELVKDRLRWQNITSDYMCKLKHEEDFAVFYEKHCTNSDIINTNRQRMNYSQTEYDSLFNQIFKGIDNKDLYLFGSGLFAKRFVDLYGRFYQPVGIVDNNTEKWNSELNGIPILGPDELLKHDVNSYKVIICIKNYTAVLKQLRELGVKNISVFDPNGVYDVDRSRVKVSIGNRDITDRSCSIGESDSSILKHDISFEEEGIESVTSKKYNIGYIAGVFDLFHIGHLNLLRRAKEQCNHLIVGVVNDEAVIKNKRVEPFVPFDERIEMVRACKYVDEAVEITYTNAGTRDAFRLYHFDVQFSGSDYVDNGSWLAEKEFLEKNGAELVFFPYTEQTSSSKIKKLIEEKLV